MAKARTCITIDGDLLKKAREIELNIFAFLEIKLREYIALIEGKDNCCKNVRK